MFAGISLNPPCPAAPPHLPRPQARARSHAPPASAPWPCSRRAGETQRRARSWQARPALSLLGLQVAATRCPCSALARPQPRRPALSALQPLHALAAQSRCQPSRCCILLFQMLPRWRRRHACNACPLTLGTHWLGPWLAAPSQRRKSSCWLQLMSTTCTPSGAAVGTPAALCCPPLMPAHLLAVMQSCRRPARRQLSCCLIAAARRHSRLPSCCCSAALTSDRRSPTVLSYCTCSPAALTHCPCPPSCCPPTLCPCSWSWTWRTLGELARAVALVTSCPWVGGSEAGNRLCFGRFGRVLERHTLLVVGFARRVEGGGAAGCLTG